MSTPLEREETTDRVLALIEVCANGDSSAKLYLTAIMRATRLADDLADGDTPINRFEAMAELLDIALVQLPNSHFFAKYAVSLATVHLTAINSWRTSELWANTDPVRERYASVFRDQILDVFAVVARLTGYQGPDINTRVREQFLKDEREPFAKPTEKAA